MKIPQSFWRDYAMDLLRENVELNHNLEKALEKTLENEKANEEKYEALLNAYQALDYCYKVKSAKVSGLKAEIKSLKEKFGNFLIKSYINKQY